MAEVHGVRETQRVLRLARILMHALPLRNVTLTTALIVLLAVVGLVPLAAFGLSAIQMISDRLVQRALTELKQSVSSDAHPLQHSLDMAQGDLPILSQVAAMQELIRAQVRRDPTQIEQWRKALEQVFLAFSANRKVYNQIRYLDEAGQELVRVDYDGTHPPRLIPRARLRNKRDRAYFSETMTLGPGYVYTSPLDLNREDGQIEVPYRPVIRYATPLFDDVGHRRGIVIINLLVGPLLEALAEAGRAARKEVYAVDQEGFYLLHPDPAKRWGGPRDRNTGERIHRDFPDLAARLLSRQAVETVMGAQIITAQPLTLSLSSVSRFFVVVELVPSSVVLAVVADFRQYLLILLVEVGVAVVVIAILLGSRFTRPIAVLEQAAHRIQQGDLQVRVEAGGSREVSALAEAFNAMAQGLAQSCDQCERQLRELTTLNRIGTAVSCTLSLNEVLDQALDATLIGLGVEAAEIFLLDEKQAEVVLTRHRGLAPETFWEISRFKLGEGFPGRVALSGEPLFTTDLVKDLRFLRKDMIEAGFSTFASIPMKVTGRVVGTLDVAIRGPHAFIEGDLSLLTTIGATIGMAIANVRLYETQRMAAIQLEATVEERTRELQATNRQLEATSRHKSAFLANMSHELRTPLNAILGFAELLRDQTSGPLNLKQGRYVSHIHSSGQHLLALINDLLDLSKVEAGKLELHPESFILQEALTVVLTEIRLQADAQALEVELRVGESLVTITADPVRFRQILLNFLSNALKATPEGGRITLTARRMQCACCMLPCAASKTSGFPEGVEIAVQDTGIGIAAEDIPKLFQPFTQLESPATKRHQGTGLGLALTKQLIELHGGSIWVASEGIGLGSTFTICLPLCHPREG